jgi:hypothetical protein
VLLWKERIPSIIQYLLSEWNKVFFNIVPHNCQGITGMRAGLLWHTLNDSKEELVSEMK